jgi:hypothetical protein
VSKRLDNATGTWNRELGTQPRYNGARLLHGEDAHVLCSENPQRFAQAYFEVYNLKLDESTLEPRVKIEIALDHGNEGIFPFTRLGQGYEYLRHRLLVHETIPFRGLQPGPTRCVSGSRTRSPGSRSSRRSNSSLNE